RLHRIVPTRNGYRWLRERSGWHRRPQDRYRRQGEALRDTSYEDTSRSGKRDQERNESGRAVEGRRFRHTDGAKIRKKPHHRWSFLPYRVKTSLLDVLSFR